MSSIIIHEDLLHICALPMLIYDFNENFNMKTKESLNEYLNNKNSDLSRLSENKKSILESIENYAPGGVVDFFLDDSDTGLQVGITRSDRKKRLCVVFRGSDDRNDWMFDLKITKQHLNKNIYVHEGFYQQLHLNNNFLNLKNKLLELLKNYNDYELIITGHSLGGALATLFGYLLSKEIMCEIKIISFASPRVGNYYFKKDFDETLHINHYRITNNRDIVTCAPMIKYNHVGKNIHLTDDSYEYYDKYNYNTWLKYSLFYCWKIRDHDIMYYYNNLKKNVW